MTVIINKECGKERVRKKKMDKSIKNLVKSINHGKDLNNNLPAYFEILEQNYYKNACIHSALEYYTLYQVICEHENQSLDEINSVLAVLNEAVEVLFNPNKDNSNLLKKLEAIRDEVIKKMDVLTAYIDLIQIYEYVLNRLEYRFKEYSLADEEVFINKLVQYIFQVKDNNVINETIKEVVGQLPVRMAKGRFFQLLKNSLTLYKGSDKASVESYLYMLRTSSMLYEPEGMDEYFPEFTALALELKDTDYKDISKEKFDLLYEKIEKASNKLFELTDLFVMVQSILNCFCVLALCKKENMDEEKEAIHLLLEINKSFSNDTILTEEDLEQNLVSLEGVQEKLSEDILTLESILFFVCHDFHKEIIDGKLDKKAKTMVKVEKLLSSSLFIDLEEQEDNETIDTMYVEQKADELIAELMELFGSNPMDVNRAVMASILNKMPVFFESSEEVMDYVKNSFDLCRDREEKRAVMEILEAIMTE